RPWDSRLTFSVATPFPFTAAVPTTVEPSLNITVPIGDPPNDGRTVTRTASASTAAYTDVPAFATACDWTADSLPRNPTPATNTARHLCAPRFGITASVAFPPVPTAPVPTS